MKNILCAALALSLIAAPARAEVTIAMVGPLTGQDAALGEQSKRGVEAAVAMINEAGGLLGQKVRAIYKDDACDPKQGVAVANQLAGEHVIGVIGPNCSGVAIPVAKILAEENILMISGTATNPMVTEQGLGTVFRVCGRDDQQGDITGKYVAAHYPGKKIAVLHDKTAYGRGLADETKKALNAAGVKETLFDSINRGERDFSALISKLKQARIDVLCYGGYYTEAGLLVRQIVDQGMKVTLIGGDGMVSNEFWSITGKAGEGTLMTFAPDPRKNPEAKDAVARIRGTGFEPEGATLQSYGAAQALFAAIAKAGKPDGAAIAKALREGEFQTVLGKLSFDAKGDVKNPQFVMYRWSSGAYQEIGE